MTTCHHCGDAIDEYKDEALMLGRCCVGLPGPWGRDENGLYTVPRERAEPIGADSDDDEDAVGVCCQHCGSNAFTFYESRTEQHEARYCVVADPNDTMLYVETGNGPDYQDHIDTTDSSITNVQCRDCGSDYTGEWDYA